MKYQRWFSILIIALTPILLITIGIRIALTPVFINVEYRLPNFPVDEYGFTTQERLDWARYSIKYVSGRIPDQDFASQTFKDGSALFNEREIRHMIDVRDLTVITLMFWRLLIILTLLLVAICWKEVKWRIPVVNTLANGAKLTLGFISAVFLYVALNFNQLFTLFHRIFFEGDTWLFYPSDTLIRLFPLVFWRDLFIFIGGFGVFISLLIIIIRKRFLNKMEAQ